ncbi:MAG TPA: hypothetical protein VFU46_10810, partial [Gemmatimonadales bacterium]|nr:hypothetical protein [Gemmatimonadales bacterium]
VMPKRSPGAESDPMARVVDRLLAQLPGADPSLHNGGDSRRASAASRQATTVVGTARASVAPTRGDLIALWARVTLALLLGALMTQWPYPRECGFPLLGYLGAVLAVVLAGAWIAFASWDARSGFAHILSLVLVFWGIVLAAEQLLPRIGYAVDRATWGCGSEGLAPAWLARLVGLG